MKRCPYWNCAVAVPARHAMQRSAVIQNRMSSLLD
jgi:hypothetical protein